MPAKRKPTAGAGRHLPPPANVTGPAREEWERIVAVAEATGRKLIAADRTLLVQYIRAWTVNEQAFDHVRKHGPVIKWPNGLPGPSPQYKVWTESARQLRGLLADLGFTPAAREFDSKPSSPAEPPPLEA